MILTTFFPIEWVPVPVPIGWKKSLDSLAIPKMGGLNKHADICKVFPHLNNTWEKKCKHNTCTYMTRAWVCTYICIVALGGLSISIYNSLIWNSAYVRILVINTSRRCHFDLFSRTTYLCTWLHISAIICQIICHFPNFYATVSRLL